MDALRTSMGTLYQRRTACWPLVTGCWVKCRLGPMGSPPYRSIKYLRKQICFLTQYCLAVVITEKITLKKLGEYFNTKNFIL